MQLTLAVFFSIIWIDNVLGTAIVELKAHSYRNPSGRCDGCEFPDYPDQNGCCDEPVFRPISQYCAVACDSVASYCSRPLGSMGIYCEEFIAGKTVSSNTNFKTFSVGDKAFFGLVNPLRLTFDVMDFVGIQILYGIDDCDTSDAEVCETSQSRIDTFLIDADITVGTASPETAYIGFASIGHLNVSFTIKCADGFYGPSCSVQCPNFVSCAGCGLSMYTGEFCQFNTETCSEEFCKGNGECVDGMAICNCDRGLTGDLCDININDCDGVSCSNVLYECIDQLNGYSCDCSPGFTGEYCQINIDDCTEVTCDDRYICFDLIDGHVCDCISGFAGELCLVNVDDCSGENCNYNGVCEDLIDGFRCECNPGFSGVKCQIVEACVGIDCNSSGVCLPNTEDLSSYICECDDGFTGDVCEVDINECDNATCENGRCIDRINGFLCMCDQGYFGESCDELDFCIGITCPVKPCKNLMDTYTCDCDRYRGNQCIEPSIVVDAIAGTTSTIMLGSVGLAFVIVMVVFVKTRRRIARDRKGSEADVYE